MHTLTQFESLQVYGGYEYNIKDAILISTGFSSFFGFAGAAACAAWFLSFPKRASIRAITATNWGAPSLTLLIALFAGFGGGVCLGSLMGLGAYYSGLAAPGEISEDQSNACT